MMIKNGYHLGKIGNKYFIWNGKKEILLEAKNFQEAKKEAEEIINNQKS